MDGGDNGTMWMDLVPSTVHLKVVKMVNCMVCTCHLNYNFLKHSVIFLSPLGKEEIKIDFSLTKFETR
jgi:hypothetical protein